MVAGDWWAEWRSGGLGLESLKDGASEIEGGSAGVVEVLRKLDMEGRGKELSEMYLGVVWVY